MDITKVKEYVFFISISLILIVLLIALFAVFNSDNYDLNYNTSSGSQTILVSSTDNLSPVGEGVTSSEVKANNETYVNFSGDGDYIITNNPITEINLANNFTICMWFNSSAESSFDKGTLFATAKDAGNRTAIQFYSNVLRAGIYNSTAYVGLKGASGIINNTWNGFCYACEGNSENPVCNLTVNRSEYSDVVSTVGSSSVLNTTFGARNDKNKFYNGSLNNILIFDRKLYQIESNAMQINKDNIYKNGVSVQQLSTGVNLLYINESGIVYGQSNHKIQKSSDDGTTWVEVYDSSSIGSDGQGIFIDSRGTIFMARENSDGLLMSMGNDTNWTFISPFVCNSTSSTGGNGLANATYWGHGLSEDSSGNLYLGEYSTGDNSYNCSFIHKSTDNGLSWNIVYNSTDYGVPARHVHLVQVDPYTDYIYATQGDGYESAILIRSIDGGETWTTLQSETSDGWSDGVDAQYTTAIFTEDYRIFGTDAHNPNKLVRTSDDINFEDIYNLSGSEDCYLWRAFKDNNGKIYESTVSESTGNFCGLLVSSDDGTTWNKILDVGTTSAVFKGISSLSNFDSTNKAYLWDNQDQKTYLFDDDSSPLLQYNLNENNGTTAHDTSGNSNDGTIIGATWVTDGILVTLTAITDYTINPTTGLFTIVNDDYSWSWMNATWSYDVYTTAGESNNEGILALVKLIEGIKFLISAVFFGAVIYIIINWGFIKNKINQ